MVSSESHLIFLLLFSVVTTASFSLFVSAESLLETTSLPYQGSGKVCVHFTLLNSDPICEIALGQVSYSDMLLRITILSYGVL